MAAEVMRHLTASASTRALTVDATVDAPQSPGAEWIVVLRARPEGAPAWSRTLRARSCADVASAAALVLAFAAERDESAAASESPPPALVVEAPMDLPPKIEAPEETPRVATKNDARSVSIFVGAGGLVDVGTLPSASGGLTIALGLRTRHVRIEASARHHPAAQTQRDAAGHGGDFSSSSLGAQGCITWSSGAFLAGPCGGAELVAISATGVGVASPIARTVLTGGPSAGVMAAWAFARHWSLNAGLRVLALVRRPQFSLDPAGPVHRPAAVAALSALSVQLDF